MARLGERKRAARWDGSISRVNFKRNCNLAATSLEKVATLLILRLAACPFYEQISMRLPSGSMMTLS
jgi:hypothetical protein